MAKDKVFRVGEHKIGISFEQFPFNSYPFYCWGHLYLFTMNVAKDIAVDCIHTCIGLDPKEIHKNKDMFCHYVIEDAHIGSCIAYTQRNKTKMLHMDHKLASHIRLVKEMNKTPIEQHISVHGLKSAHQWSDIHKFYTLKGLL
ncbi:uncharacterized protein LOC142353131 [Convolutriloba macropyga]|uniref:uncharacterized protein LOC142353131 n=1 Tax=Convolutriloba macropyga TaxID=536237 RepID=UPI003F52877D